MRKLALVMITAVLLTGCTDLTPEEQSASDVAACTGYGFKEGTDAFADCRLRLAQERQADSRAMAAAFASRPQVQPYQMPMPQAPRRPINCTSYNTGVFTNTNCY